ncbi:MAG TPA: restriction endonuclease [Candidatus Dormibacteraeota bacterium]
MIRPRRPPPRPLKDHARGFYRALRRLALRGPLWTPLAMAAIAFALVTLAPVPWGGGLGLQQPWHTVALLAAAGALLVGVSAWPERYRAHRGDLTRRDLEELRRLPRERLAELVAAAYRRAGYEAVETGRGVGAGIDVELHNRRGTALVQCRHYRQASVDIGALRELHGVIRAVGAAGGVVVTTGEFTDVAGSFARVHRITMVDGRTLLRMVRVVHPARASGRLASQ